MSESVGTNALALTAQIVSAYAWQIEEQGKQLPEVIPVVHGALSNLDKGAVTTPVQLGTQPAVPVARSVFPGYVVCLECKWSLQMLRRHLFTRHNLTPGQYRAKWNLPANYPMVAPNYAEKRSELAIKSGLGKKQKDSV